MEREILNELFKLVIGTPIPQPVPYPTPSGKKQRKKKETVPRPLKAPFHRIEE